MIDEIEVMKIVIEKLRATGISYMITGSIALNFYTTPRMTRDIDIVIKIGENDVEKIFLLFLEDFYIDRQLIQNAIRNKGMFNIIHNEAIIKIDFIVRKDTEYRKAEFERRRCINFQGLTIYVTSPEDLILSKLEWASNSLSEMQLRDVRNLLMMPNLDRDYIKYWVERLGLSDIYKRAIV